MEHNKVVFESKVSEIFESPEIKAIEIEILNLYYEINRRGKQTRGINSRSRGF